VPDAQASVNGKGGLVMVILQFVVTVFLAELPEESITWAVNEDVPAATGVPLIAPVERFRLSPCGRLPEMMEKEYGGTPPVAMRLEAYGVPTCPLLTGQFSARGGGGADIKFTSKERDDPAPSVATTTSVIENGWLVGPGPVFVPESVEVKLRVPTFVPVPNAVFVLST